MIEPAEETIAARPTCRLRLEPGRTVEWNGRPYRLDRAGPSVCELVAGRVRLDVATSDLVATMMPEGPTAVDDVAIADHSTDRSGWHRASTSHRHRAVELSYRLNELLTGHRLGAPETGAPDEFWAPFGELASLTQRSDRMAEEISDDPQSKQTIGIATITGRSLRRLAKRFVDADYDPASLLDERFMAVKDPSYGLTDEQRSVVDAQLLEQKGSSDVSQRVLLSKIRIAMTQRSVAAPESAKLRRYVSNARKRHDLTKNAKRPRG